MSDATRAPITNAQKVAERRRQFFEALATHAEKQKEKSHYSQAQQTTQAHIQQDHAGDSARSSSASSAAHSTLSEVSEEQLKRLHRAIRANKGTLQIPPFTLEEHKAFPELYTLPHAELPPFMARLRQASDEMQGAWKELDETPMEQIKSTELQELKRSLSRFRRESRANDPFHPAQVERRINAALKAGGEPDVEVPHVYEWDFSKCPPEKVNLGTREDIAVIGRTLEKRMEDLAPRKPHLHSTVMGIMDESVHHQKKLVQMYGSEDLQS